MKASDFKPGQRVRILDYRMAAGPVEGTVLDTFGDLIEVQRDDGVRGGGTSGGWVVYAELYGRAIVELIDAQEEADPLAMYATDPTGSSTPAKSNHMAGIDREEIDQDAHRDFMRSL